jgi:hypothetical protein
MGMKEEMMAGRIRIVQIIAIAMFLLGFAVAMSGMGNAAERNTVVTGIVEYTHGDEITVARKTYDLKGARLQDGHGVPLAPPIDLRGKTVEILSRNGRVESVTVYRMLPQ